MRVREKSVSLVRVAHCLVLEIRPEGLPDGMRVGGGGAGREEGKGRLKHEPSALGLSNWPHGPAGSWKREGSARSILRDKRAKISGFLRT